MSPAFPARVSWALRQWLANLPQSAVENNIRTHRSILIDNEEFEFSDGFTELHNRSYEKILHGEGFGLEDNRIAIETVSALRNMEISTKGEIHPQVWKAKSNVGGSNYEENLLQYNRDS